MFAAEIMYTRKQMDWSFFDAIRCINLEEHTDRLEQVQQIFHAYQIPVRMFTAQRHPQGGEAGCFDSHVQLAIDAYEKQVNYLLIFEDDITWPENLTMDRLRHVTNFLKNHSCDIFYLGLMPFFGPGKVKYTSTPGIYSVPSSGTHAYILTKSGICKVRQWLYAGTAIDDAYKHELSHYAIYPSIFYQGGFPSSIQKHTLRTHTKLSQCHIRCCEWSAYYLNCPFLLVISLFVIMMCIVVVLVRKKSYPRRTTSKSAPL